MVGPTMRHENPNTLNGCDELGTGAANGSKSGRRGPRAVSIGLVPWEGGWRRPTRESSPNLTVYFGRRNGEERYPWILMAGRVGYRINSSRVSVFWLCWALSRWWNGRSVDKHSRQSSMDGTSGLPSRPHSPVQPHAGDCVQEGQARRWARMRRSDRPRDTRSSH